MLHSTEADISAPSTYRSLGSLVGCGHMHLVYASACEGLHGPSSACAALSMYDAAAAGAHPTGSSWSWQPGASIVSGSHILSAHIIVGAARLEQ